MKLPEIRLPQMRIPNVRLPASGLPIMPSGGFSAQGIGSSAAVLVAIVVLFVLAMSYSGKLAGAVGAAKLAPLIRRRLKSTTANEQVQWLFEDAALDKLGDVSATMNHRAIESNLVRRWPATTPDASEFAALYERARYVPNPADIGAVEVARAKLLADALKSTRSTSVN